MAAITFLGGEETGNVAYVDWGRYRFHIGQAVECSDPHIIAKARGNRFFQVGGLAEADPPLLTPIEKARAAKAAKKAAVQPPVPFSQTDDAS
jgi:hypothetical protein